MFTVCPKCMLTLAVTANDLRMGQGYVRCGRCANVFNALLTLSEEPAQAEGASSEPTPADRASSSQIAQALRGAAPESGAPPSSSSSPKPQPQPQPQPPSTAAAPPGAGAELPMHLPTEQSSDGAIENESNFADGTGTFETIVLEGEAITQTEEYVPESSVDSEIAALTQRLAHSSRELPTRLEAGSDAPGEVDLEAEADADADADAEESEAEEDRVESAGFDELPPSTPARAARPYWAWITGSVALLLLLALQAIHHWRDALAVSPPWNSLLTRAYAAVGVPLDPHWDLRAYDVRQQGAVADPADSQLIRVRLSLANHAERAQPLPLLRLTLLDRYGKRIAAGEVAPSQYWPTSTPPPAFMGHDERIDSQVSVRDPSASSASFELDVCLRSSDGALRCAGELPPNPTIAGAAHP